MNKPTIIIAFSGRKRAGKSTAKERLERELLDAGFACTALSVAAPLKEVCVFLLDALGVATPEHPDNGVWIYERKEDFIAGTPSGVTGRRLMQTVGQAVKDAFYGRNVWADALAREAAAFVDERPTGGVILIDDIRFPEECAALAAVVPVYAYRLEGGDVGDGHVSESGAGLEGFASLTPDFADANFAWLNPVRVACGLPDLCAYRVSA